MALEVKICGLNTPAAVEAALAGGAAMVGFNFFPRSPRAVTPQEAVELARPIGPSVLKVGVVVDPDDATLGDIVARAPLDMLQLHGDETPGRVAEIRERTHLPIMKVIKVVTAKDLAQAEAYLPVADRLLFEPKPPKSLKNALPGGNAVAFDWQIISGKTWPRPWMLSGGLDADNLAEAVKISGARAVDVSSGVESAPGTKDPAKIRAFLERAKVL